MLGIGPKIGTGAAAKDQVIKSRMRSQELPEPGPYVRLLADHARQLQCEARSALERGDYTRATALLADAELLAEDVHHLVIDIERCEIGGLMQLSDYDVREAALPEPAVSQSRLALTSRRLRMAIGTSLLMGLALTEW